MEINSGFSYDEYMAILERDNGWVPVCVPCIDADGTPAMLTTYYSIEGLDCMDDWQVMDHPTTVTALAMMMTRSRDTIREHGGTPLDEV